MPTDESTIGINQPRTACFEFNGYPVKLIVLSPCSAFASSASLFSFK